MLQFVVYTGVWIQGCFGGSKPRTPISTALDSSNTGNGLNSRMVESRPYVKRFILWLTCSKKGNAGLPVSLSRGQAGRTTSVFALMAIFCEFIKIAKFIAQSYCSRLPAQFPLIAVLTMQNGLATGGDC